MFGSLIAKNLRLHLNEKRHFLVSVSGGSDSVFLLTQMNELRKTFPIKLRIFHMNFQLRGRESLGDERFVRGLARKLKIPISVCRVKKNSTTLVGVQEWARSERLKGAQKFRSVYELVEAHHLDDQVETFFMRLMRGTGLSGLVCIQPYGIREDRRVWRPLLSISKQQILAFLSAHRVKFREDSSNRQTNYDRNWLRNKILPLLRRREPHFPSKIGYLVDEIQELDAERSEVFLSQRERVLSTAAMNPTNWDWPQVRSMKPGERKTFIRSIFKDVWRVNLNRSQTVELSHFLAGFESFCLNLPKGIVMRGFKSSQRYPQGQLKIDDSRSKVSF